MAPGTPATISVTAAACTSTGSNQRPRYPAAISAANNATPRARPCPCA